MSRNNIDITSVTVTAARTFNHPTERYANFRFEISLEANINPGGPLHKGADAWATLQELQERAEQMAEAHKARILADITRSNLIKNAIAMRQSWEGQPIDFPQRQQRLDELAGKLERLTAEPLMLGIKEIHPGHPDHPDSDLGPQYWEN